MIASFMQASARQRHSRHVRWAGKARARVSCAMISATTSRRPAFLAASNSIYMKRSRCQRDIFLGGHRAGWAAIRGCRLEWHRADRAGAARCDVRVCGAAVHRGSSPIWAPAGRRVFPAGDTRLNRVRYGCGPHGAAWSSFTSWVINSGRNFEAKPSTKSLFAYTAAQCARRSASSSNFQRWTS